MLLAFRPPIGSRLPWVTVPESKSVLSSRATKFEVGWLILLNHGQDSPVSGAIITFILYLLHPFGYFNESSKVAKRVRDKTCVFG